MPKDEDLLYTLPKYAMYVNLGIIRDESLKYKIGPNPYGTHLVKFCDAYGNIDYGFIQVTDRVDIGAVPEPFPVKVTEQIKEDINVYKNQREFTNYIVDETHSILIPSTRESIDERSCVIYKLKEDVKLYSSDHQYKGILKAGTQIALNVCDTGVTDNKLICVYRIKKDNVWQSPVSGENAGYIEYLLEKGSMPIDRVINN